MAHAARAKTGLRATSARRVNLNSRRQTKQRSLASPGACPTRIRLAHASRTADFAAALARVVPSITNCLSAGSAPLSSAEARAAQPALEIWVPLRSSE
eukprot:scaffold92278_cov62-Phaeocystis_antarctica.AAC.11